MKLSRTLHLWIGLITSVFILIESVTGFLMLEPQLIGGQSKAKMEMAHAGNKSGARYGDRQSSPDQALTQQAGRSGPSLEGGDKGESSLQRFIKELHTGRVGSVDLTLVMEITAIGMIVLTLTGIVLSIRVLKAQRRSRLKKRAALG